MDSVRKLPFPRQVAFFNRYDAVALLGDLRHVQPDTIPGTKYRYNNTAYSLLICLLEQVYHKPFDELIAGYLRRHLQMMHTREFVPKAGHNRIAQGYGLHDQPMHFINLESYYMGPSINTNLNDMLTYIAAQLSESDPAIRLTHQRTFGIADGFALGLGWMIDTENGDRYFYHDGKTKFSFNTLCTFYPQQKLGIIIMVNDTRSLEKVGELENAIRKYLIN